MSSGTTLLTPAWCGACILEIATHFPLESKTTVQVYLIIMDNSVWKCFFIELAVNKPQLKAVVIAYATTR